MSVSREKLDGIRQQHSDFQYLVQQSTQDELGQCAKLLAMYLAIYKQRYGELPLDNLSYIADMDTVNNELSGIIKDAIDEASTMLRTIRDEKQNQQDVFYYYPAESSIN